MGECMGGSVGQWVGSGQITKYIINLDIIEIIQFYLKIYDLQRLPTHAWVCGWFGGSVGQWVGSGQITKYLINLDLIERIQFCLKIYVLWRHSQLWWVCGWFDGWLCICMGYVKSLKI